MKKLALGLGLVGVLAVALFADNPHFIRVTSSINNDGDATISWKEAGLGDSVLVSYTLTADATATYHCVNNGGKCPNAANKQDVQGPVSASGTFASGKNGQITASLTVEPPAAAPFCPSGQHEKLTDVTFTNVVLTDTTNNVTALVPTLSATTAVCK